MSPGSRVSGGWRWGKLGADWRVGGSPTSSPCFASSRKQPALSASLISPLEILHVKKENSSVLSQHFCILKEFCSYSSKFESSYGRSNLTFKIRVGHYRSDFYTRRKNKALFRRKVPDMKSQFCYLAVV